MKKLLFALFAAAFLFAGNVGAQATGDTVGINYIQSIGSVTVDSAWDVAWEIIDSIVVVGVDTTSGVSTVALTYSGIAIFDPGDLLWIGFANADSECVVDSLAYTNTRNLDSCLIKGLGRWSRGRQYVPFSVSAVTTVGTGVTDTLWITAACGGTSAIEEVSLTNTVVQAKLGYP